MSPRTASRVVVGIASLWIASTSMAQQVCLPAPRLLTVTPMGGQVGTTVEVTVSGESIDDATELLFSDSRITAKPQLDAAGKPKVNQFTVTVPADVSPGVYEARVMTRLGASSSRAFSVGTLAEVRKMNPNNSLETALELKPNSVCNAVMTKQAIDFYSFQGVKGKRMVVDLAAAGIDSRLTAAVLIVADEQGRDLMVSRTGGAVEFTPPADGKYLIKVHSLTFQGGVHHFYRLALMEAPASGPSPRQASTQTLNSFSWNNDNANVPKVTEAEPNNSHAAAQKITLPCDIAGQFHPAADVDTYEFEAKKGDVWWVEVASERLGLPTDPFVLVQRVTKEGDKEKFVDVAELNDIPSPMKPSSNGYSYDGPPYDAGSADPLGKLEIKEDGIYRLQIRDLFGGTRTDPNHVYRLIVRKAAPDFSLVAWAIHMGLRNGDRAALSKPIALRKGATMALEVVTVRRDGFNEEIELAMEGLPPGVTASGLTIPAGKNQGMVLITAAEDAQSSFGVAKIVGRAQVNGATVSRPCRLASLIWPVRDAKQEIPRPRLLADVPVSVTGAEDAPITVTAAENKVVEAKAGEKIKIPLKLSWRGEFSGSLKLKAAGAAFAAVKPFDVPLKAATSEVELDLTALKVAPGEYTLAFYGGAVTKYRYNPDAVKTAEEEQKKAEQEALTAAGEAKKLADAAKAAPADKKAEVENAAKMAAEKMKAAEVAKVDAAKRMKAAVDAATPKDTVDIVVSEPIRIVVKPGNQT